MSEGGIAVRERPSEDFVLEARGTLSGFCRCRFRLISLGSRKMMEERFLDPVRLTVMVSMKGCGTVLETLLTLTISINHRYRTYNRSTYTLCLLQNFEDSSHFNLSVSQPNNRILLPLYRFLAHV